MVQSFLVDWWDVHWKGEAIAMFFMPSSNISTNVQYCHYLYRMFSKIFLPFCKGKIIIYILILLHWWSYTINIQSQRVPWNWYWNELKDVPYFMICQYAFSIVKERHSLILRINLWASILNSLHSLSAINYYTYRDGSEIVNDKRENDGKQMIIQ